MIGINFDSTDRKLAEAEREELLRRERDARAEADRMNRAKDEFVAMLAHELRNPLAPIRSSVAVLRLLGSDASRQARTADVIDRQVSHMTRLLDDLLDVSRITRGRITLTKCNVPVDRVVAQAIETAHALIGEKGHDLRVLLPAGPLWIEADEARMVQVVGNLVTNAAKFTPRGGTITIEAGSTRDGVSLRVRDTGVGIASDALGRIFELFAQGSAAPDRRRGGLGLGLTLVRALVELHDGRISAASAGPGAGSTFEVSLPLLPPALPLTSRERPAHAPASHRLRVLVVDDNRDLASSLAALLEIAGHEVRAVYDAPSALTEAEAFTADVAFIDIGLPGIDGYELARRLRARPNAPSVLIALSGYGRDEDKQRAAAAGFHHHLTKPADPTVIEDLLERLAAGSAGSVPAARLLH
jgi:CheY-like chemotaxis protein/nitrogen-specific signal transduction histidine kinase